MDYYIAFWNLENLFDVSTSPRRSDKLQRVLRGELKGWTQAVLSRKLSQLSSVITRMNGGAGPDLLGVCEVENEHVLQLLVEALSPLSRNYQIVHADTSDRRGIDVAFIYDADRLQSDLVFSHFVVKRTATRDILQVNFGTASGKRLVAICNHWPSRRGGQYASEPFRIIAAETLAYFHERIREIYGDDVGVVVMGDFNDEPFDRSVSEHANGERTRSKVTRSRSATLLNVTWRAIGEFKGTHYYENRPGMLDQFMVSKGFLTGSSGFRVDADSVGIIAFEDMVDDGTYPKPIPYGRPSASAGVNRNGFSDHFPIGMSIKETV